MKLIATSLLALSLLGGITAAYAGDSDDCHSISDSVYGIWGCR
jgi:hypothetical protein